MKVVILLSGGLDSAVVLARSLVNGDEPFCLGVDYGQRHRRELESAVKIADYYRVPFSVVKLPDGLLGKSALTGGVEVVPKDLRFDDAGQKATVVHGRNVTFISLAVAHALENGCQSVLMGAHKGDAAVYSDCREEFVRSADKTVWLGYGIRVCAPLIKEDKKGVVAYAKVMKVPVDLTWSCYEGGTAACNRCGACVERNEAFAE